MQCQRRDDHVAEGATLTHELRHKPSETERLAGVGKRIFSLYKDDLTVPVSFKRGAVPKLKPLLRRLHIANYGFSLAVGLFDPGKNDGLARLQDQDRRQGASEPVETAPGKFDELSAQSNFVGDLDQRGRRHPPVGIRARNLQQIWLG